MDGYKIDYDIDRVNTSGTMHIAVSDQHEALAKFWERIRETWDYELTENILFEADVTILKCEPVTFQACKSCGQPMGNLGLVFDECVNEKCPLYANAEKQ